MRYRDKRQHKPKPEVTMFVNSWGEYAVVVDGKVRDMRLSEAGAKKLMKRYRG